VKKYFPFILLFIGAASIWFIKSHQRGSEPQVITTDTSLNDNRPLVVPAVKMDTIENVTSPNRK
jgi:hypothetical protein